MLIRREKTKITRSITGMVAVSLITATVACRAAFPPLGPSLPPVTAPLAPARPDTRFAPVAAARAHTDLSGEPLPPRTTGTHVTAVLARGEGTRLIAVWGDPVLWEQIGKTYRPAPGLPPLTGTAAEVIALDNGSATGQVVITTRREGQFTVQSGQWVPQPHPNAPYDANAQALAAYRGALWVATLNDGLVVRDRNGVWQHLSPPQISSNAPRQFVVWHDALWVRHGNGRVDCYDGRTWTHDVFTALLPRHQVSALATDGETLFLAQWGGWSETRDAQTFVHHFPDDLKNMPLTALLPLTTACYVGTQGRGLAECDRDTGIVRRWHDERHGIGDDWITALARTPTGSVVVGTWVGGAYQSTDTAGQGWQPIPGTENGCVTAIADTASSVFVCLRRGGVFSYTAPARASAFASVKETQCVLPDPDNHLLWVGTRTGIVTVPWNATLQTAEGKRTAARTNR